MCGSVTQTVEISSIPERIRVLLVEDSTADAFLVTRMLDTLEWAHVTVESTVKTLAEMVEAVGAVEHDAILLDLNLPDSFGVDTLKDVVAAAPGIPVVVLTGLADEQLALMAMERGAQDYLVKGEFDARLLVRTLRYGIQRQRLVERLAASLASGGGEGASRSSGPGLGAGDFVDAESGLRSRKGFFHLAEHHVRFAARTRSELTLFLFSIERSLASTATPTPGQRAAVLQGMAALLRRTFRGTDILARVGEDEFAAIALETTSDGPETITRRLGGSPEGSPSDRTGCCECVYTVRRAVSTPDEACTLEDLLSRAGAAPATSRSLRCSLE